MRFWDLASTWREVSSGRRNGEADSDDLAGLIAQIFERVSLKMAAEVVGFKVATPGGRGGGGDVDANDGLQIRGVRGEDGTFREDIENFYNAVRKVVADHPEMGHDPKWAGFQDNF